MPRRLLNSGYRWILVGFLLLAIGTGAAIYLSDRQGAATDHKIIQESHQTDLKICKALNNINGVIRAQLERSKTNIPKLDYFRQHPKERDEQLREVDRSLRVFRSNPC